LFQAILAAPRIGGLGFQVAVCVAALLMAMAAALAASAAVRLIGVGFLGRPRSPRAAAAEEAGRATQAAMLGLAILSGVIGLVPGLVLQLAAPASRLLVGGGMGGRAGLLGMAPQLDAPGYAPVAICVLLGASLAMVIAMVRRYAVPGHRRGPAWDCGFGAPPAWLPFGDPASQYGGASFGQPLRRMLGTGILHARERVDMPEPGDTRAAHLTVTLRDPADAALFGPVGLLRDRISGFTDRMQFLTVRRTLAVMFFALVLFLTGIAVLEQL
jgi:hypothetical protein